MDYFVWVVHSQGFRHFARMLYLLYALQLIVQMIKCHYFSKKNMKNIDTQKKINYFCLSPFLKRIFW